MNAQEVATYRTQQATDVDLVSAVLLTSHATSDAILGASGGLAGLLAAEVETLTAIKGMTQGRVARLRAAVELTRRMLQAEAACTRTRIGASSAVVELLQPRLMGLQHETCWTVMLNGGNEVVSLEMLSQGSLTESPIYPREIVTRANRHHAAAFILVHNHPSGISMPSAGDRQLTQELVLAGELLRLPLVDHVIIGRADHFSFADHGLIDEYRKRARKEHAS